MLKHLVRATLVVTLTCAVGCSGDDDDDENPAVGKCRHLIDLYCPAILDCAVGAGTVPEEDRDAAVADCETGAKQALDCSAAIGVSSSYDSCIEALENPDCDAINEALASDGTISPLPTVCGGVIELL
jgi:hypothetical protein